MFGLAEALDPEMAREFRRGYRYGAKAMLEALEQRLPVEEVQRIRVFLESELLDWVDSSDFKPPPLPLSDELDASWMPAL